MVEKIIINPEEIRGLGNIVSSNHSLEDYKVYMSTLEEGTAEIEGVETVVYEMDPLGSDISIALTLSASTISIGGTVTVTATVTEDESPVSGVSVSFKQGDTVLGSSTTNSSGVATYTYTGAEVGTYTIRATYNNVYSNAETLLVDKVNTTTTFTATPAMVTVGGDIVMTATVLDENSNPVNNEYVEFYVYYGGHSIALAPRKTNSSGVATYTWKTNRTGDMEAYAIFQNCPNYNSSESNHVPVSIDSHTYSLQFSESSYTATGGTCTVSVLLEKDSAPLANAEVTFSSDESSTVTATTGSDGVASATISFNDSTTLLASYNNITDTAEITVVPAYLFYDDASTSRISEYTTKGNQTITYDSNGYYTIAVTSQSCPNVKINSFTAPNRVKISLDMYILSGSNAQPKIYLFDESKNKGYGLRVTNNNNKWNLQTITSYTDCGNNLNETSLYTSKTTWYTLEVIIDNNDLTGHIYNSGGTLLSTITASGSLNLSSTGNYVAIGTNYTTDTILRVKNIKVEAL